MIRGNGVDKIFCVCKIGVNNIGVEKIFFFYSESLVSVEVLCVGRVRCVKFYYLRDRRGKVVRIKEVCY